MKHKLNILMLNYEFPPIGGGAANAHYHILKEYAKMPELKVDVLTSAQQPGFFEEEFAKNVTIYKVGLHKKDLHYWLKSEVIEWLIKSRGAYRKLLKENSYNLVHAFFAFPSGYLCYKTKSRLPYVVSLRGSDVPGYNMRLGLDYKLLKGLFTRIWSSASAIVANSEGLRRLALEFMPEADISVIYNGVNVERFYPVENKTIGKQVRLLTVSRLISRKRIDILIEAAAKLKTSGHNVALNIAGEGNLMKDLKALAKRLGIGDYVNFLGRVEAEDIPAVYGKNDIFVMSSEHEGMSNAMLEAMACGLPIVTTKCEGIEELIDENGVVVERAEAGEIASRIEEIASDKAIYDKMSIAARKKAEDFSWSNCSLRYISLYKAVK